MSIEKHSLTTLTTQFIMLFFTAITTVIIARTLGRAGKGAATLVVLIPTTLVNLGNFGVGMANVYYVGKKEQLEKIVSNSVSFVLLIGGALVLLMFALLPFLRNTVFKSLSNVTIVTAILITPVFLLHMYWSTIVVGLKKIYFFNLTSILRSAINFAIVLVSLFILKLSYFGVLIAFIVSVASVDLMFYIFFKKKMGLKRVISKPDFALARKTLVYGVKGFFSNIFNIMNLRIDVFIASYFLTLAAVGLYSIATNVAEILWYLANSVSIVLFPTVASAEPDEAKRITPIVCRNVIFLTFSAAAILFFTAKYIILIAVPKFMPSVRVIQILLPAIVMFTIPKVLGADILGRGRPEISAISNFMAVAINIVLNIFLIPIYGISGAALSSVFSYGAAALFITVSYVIISGNSPFETLIVKASDRFYYYRLLRSIYSRVYLRNSGAGTNEGSYS